MPGIGYQTLLYLLPHILELPPDVVSLRSVLPAIPTISPHRMRTILTLEAPQVYQVKQSLSERQIDTITIFDEDYPPLLREIDDPPLILYAKGSRQALSGPTLAIVGARRPSNYGRQVAFHLGSDLANIGFTIVSGLARGIDAEAHKGALHRGGKTIAVLGCGVDVIYPSQNKALYHAITKNGLILSEYLPDRQPHPRLFPLRNRMISGLSLGITVVEAALSSGSLNTAKHASEQNRDVFAVPGPISSPVSQGANNLIRDGAIPLTKVDDVLLQYEHLALPLGAQEISVDEQLTRNEKKILEMIENTQATVDQIVRCTSLGVQEVTQSLLNLQLQGKIRQLPGCMYGKVR
ncbi:DNA protecting protein DprA [Ammoniphilus oxalaticus]|uniref:DNA protecting protein DprA n=2 Tax=Ammoniphilus oxalaticus TaxID=66863 RepID=A0A419SL10_9BACL|nr:DNA protecting protein DprA [Ammoniphilus oxalaticus]